MEEKQKSFCSNCGAELSPGAKFCPVCGTPTDHGSQPAPKKGIGRAFIIIPVVLALLAVGYFGGKALFGDGGKTPEKPDDPPQTVTVKVTVDPFTGLTVKFSGYNGYGYISEIEPDMHKSFSAVYDRISELQDQLKNELDQTKRSTLQGKIDLLVRFLNSVEYMPSQKVGLKNNEDVTIQCNYDASLLAQTEFVISPDTELRRYGDFEKVYDSLKVTDKSVRVRTGPGTKYDILKINGKNQYYTKGATLPIIDGEWNEKDGYMWFKVIYMTDDAVYYTWIREDFTNWGIPN